MTTCCLPASSVIPLHTPWWRRAWTASLTLWRRPARPVPMPDPSQPHSWAPADWRTLQHLNEGTLRDIGAPEWMHDGRQRQRDAALDLLRL